MIEVICMAAVPLLIGYNKDNRVIKKINIIEYQEDFLICRKRLVLNKNLHL